MLACHPLPRFQLADLVKLPVESKEFEDFSTTLKSDHDWDEENPIERGFKKAGLARYHVEGFKDLKVENHTLKNSESLAATRQPPQPGWVTPWPCKTRGRSR